MKALMMVCAVVLSSAMGMGCAYAGVAVTADGHAVVARNDAFLFGLLRSVAVCQVTPAGLAQCATGEAP